jgi:hypothetical protein
MFQNYILECVDILFQLPKRPNTKAITTVLKCWKDRKVEGHIPARVWMPPPRVGGTYLGAFTVHSTANVLQAANGRF